MQTSIKLVLLVVTLVAVSGGTYALLSLDPFRPDSVRDVNVSQVVENPREFTGKVVEVEGKLIKELTVADAPFFLRSDKSSLLLHSSESLGKYLDLIIRVEGVINYDPDAVGRPSTSLKVQKLDVVNGEPKIFIDDRGRHELGRHFILDNNANALVYDTLNRQIIFTGDLSDAKIQKVTETIIENGFFEMETKRYSGGGGTGINYTYELKVILVIDGEVKENEITWTSTRGLPDQLLSIEEVINSDLFGIVPGG